MKIQTIRMLGVITIIAAGAAAMVGCGKKSETESTESPGVVEQSKDAAGRAGAATKDATGRAMEKTGEALEKTGDAMQETGEGMQR